MPLRGFSTVCKRFRSSADSPGEAAQIESTLNRARQAVPNPAPLAVPTLMGGRIRRPG